MGLEESIHNVCSSDFPPRRAPSRRRVLRSLGFWVLLAVAISFPSAAAQEADVYRFPIPAVEAYPGDDIRVTVQGEHSKSAQGFSFAFRYPSRDLTIRRAHIKDTILEAIGTDYFDAKISPEDGTVVVGVLVDSRPPFDGNLIPSIGQPLDFVYFECTVSGAAEGDLKIRFEDGLSAPPIRNLYAVDNESIPVTELGEGTIRLKGSCCKPAAFIRGDFNRDGDVDISDPVAILGYVFYARSVQRCALAGDANDDDTIDIADPIFLFSFLFQKGSPPPPPFPSAGFDPAPGALVCW